MYDDNIKNQNHLKVRPIPSDKDETWALAQRGLFFLNDFFKLLDDSDRKYKQCLKQVQRIIDLGNDPYEVMGRIKSGKRVVINMEIFAPWYRKNLLLKTQKLDGGLDFKSFISNQTGIFRLSEVCNFYNDFLPFSYSILKRATEKSEDSLNEFGVVKFDTTFLVVMPRFGRWLRAQILA